MARSQHGHQGRIDDIECLRAVAVGFVIVAHFGTLLPFPSPAYHAVTDTFDFTVGVDLFFVISGFVIARSLAASGAAQPVSRLRLIAAFWIRRVYRLLPTAMLWLLLLMAFLAATADLPRLLIPILAAMLNVMNLYNAWCGSRPDDQLLCNIYYAHGHYWSLSLEEQFYFVFPWLFFFLDRRLLIGLLAGTIVLQLFWERSIWSFGWFFRIDALSWGVLLALLSTGRRYGAPGRLFARGGALSMAVFLALLGLLAYCAKQFVGFGGAGTPFGVGLVAIIGALLVWLASQGRDLLAVGTVWRAVALYVGTRSYALYVSHLLLFTMIAHALDRFGVDDLAAGMTGFANIGLLLVGLGATVLVSEGTYRWIEVPARSRGRRVAERLLAPP